MSESAMSDLCELAERFVALSGELEHVRRQMLSALSNGHGGGPDLPPRPMTARRRAIAPGERAAEAEAEIVEMLKLEALGPAEIARRTGAQTSTVGERLRRLKEKGAIERVDDGWRAMAPSS
jgi:predicted Rossmann fold nucleotide-binding protein DprA/Smf involved in DNA uptake